MSGRHNSGSRRYPIDEYKKHILYQLEKKQILIIAGETGSGKSTRIPQFLVCSGKYNHKIHPFDESNTNDVQFKQICVTQPRRVAATQLALRLSQELDCDLGSAVGYAIRFEDVTDPKQTLVKYVTEGILLREMLYNPLLNNYSVIMIDEVHERNLNTDIILGLLKCILLKRPDLKLIVCSATANVDQLFNFFSYADVKMETEVENPRSTVLLTHGKSYPLRIYYSAEPVANYLDATVNTVKSIHENNRLSSGKILIFLTGQDEVEYVIDRLTDYSMTLTKRLDVLQLLPLPLHADLKAGDISKAFDDHGRNTRVCIVSTNVAETSLTISGVAFVIDCGFMKLKIHDCYTGSDTLVRVPISRSSAKQRAGRAGRTRDGVVYRLYPESQYQQLSSDTMPEIQRSPLSEVVVLLKSLGIDDIINFPLMSKMPPKNLVSALELLFALQAIDELGTLSPTGELMAQFNLDPRLAKMLVSLESASCTSEACKIAAMLQVKDIYNRTSNRATGLWTNANLVGLCSNEGDMLTYLNILNGFISSHKNQRWAERRNLNHHVLLNACLIADKLGRQLERIGLSLTTSMGRTELIQRSVVSGLFPNAAYLHPSGDYKTIREDRTVFVHPTSVINEVVDRPKLVVFFEMMSTTKPYMRHVMSVEQGMLLDSAPHYYTFSSEIELNRNKYC